MIRRLEPRDKEEFIELIRLFYKQRLEVDGTKFSYAASSEQFDIFINMEGIVGFVAEVDGKVVGTIVGAVGPILFGEGKMAQEMVWYVHEEHRGSGLRLIRAWEKYAKEQGCSIVIMCGMAGDKSEKFYIKDGYVEIQNNFQKRIG
jgi:GNAT superfamily N-acetyltransferase